jgi:hypothetical protein
VPKKIPNKLQWEERLVHRCHTAEIVFFSLKQFNQNIRIPQLNVSIYEDLPNGCGDKYFSSIFNNLAVHVFYSKLQLIQNFLKNGLVPPSPPRSPTNLEGNNLCDLVGRPAACQCQKKFQTNCNMQFILNILASFKRMALHNNQCAFGIVGSRSVPQHESSFWHVHTTLFHPTLCKPSMNGNRSHNMLGPLRSPPPAANWNRASSTAQCIVYSYCYDNLSDASSLYRVSYLWMWRAGCFALGAKGRIECTHHSWCRCVTVSFINTIILR